jgi:hypothetical protein
VVSCIFSPVHVTICCGLWPPGNTTCLFLTWYQSARFRSSPCSRRRRPPRPSAAAPGRRRRLSLAVGELRPLSPLDRPWSRRPDRPRSPGPRPVPGLVPSRSRSASISGGRLRSHRPPRSRPASDLARPRSLEVAPGQLLGAPGIGPALAPRPVPSLVPSFVPPPRPHQASPDSAAGRRKRSPPAGIGLCCRELAGGAGPRPISAGHRPAVCS